MSLPANAANWRERELTVSCVVVASVTCEAGRGNDENLLSSPTADTRISYPQQNNSRNTGTYLSSVWLRMVYFLYYDSVI